MDSFSQAIKKADTDEWFTNRKDVEIIVPYLKECGYKKILCPFDKEQSNYVKVLRENGFDVTYGHIADGKDFFDIQDFSGYDAVVSNPPFSKRQKILERLFESKIPFALIMNSNGLFDAKSRWKLFRDNDFELLIPQGRMKFFNEEHTSTSSPNFQSIYVCHGMSNKQICFIESEAE